MADIDAASLGLPESTNEREPLTDIGKRYIELRKRRNDLKAQFEEIEAETKALNAYMTERFLEEDVRSLVVMGKNLHLHTAEWGSAVDEDTAGMRAALKSDESTAWLVKDAVNAKTLQSWILEQERDPQTMGRILPDHVKNHMKVVEKTDVRMTIAKAKK